MVRHFPPEISILTVPETFHCSAKKAFGSLRLTRVLACPSRAPPGDNALPVFMRAPCLASPRVASRRARTPAHPFCHVTFNLPCRAAGHLPCAAGLLATARGRTSRARPHLARTAASRAQPTAARATGRQTHERPRSPSRPPQPAWAAESTSVVASDRHPRHFTPPTSMADHPGAGADHPGPDSDHPGQQGRPCQAARSNDEGLQSVQPQLD